MTVAEDPMAVVRAAVAEDAFGLTTTDLVRCTGLSMLQVLRALQVLLNRGAVRVDRRGLTYISTE